MGHRLVSMGLVVISDNVYTVTFSVDNRLLWIRMEHGSIDSAYINARFLVASA